MARLETKLALYVSTSIKLLKYFYEVFKAINRLKNQYAGCKVTGVSMNSEWLRKYHNLLIYM
jgi:hypothetical protein